MPPVIAAAAIGAGASLVSGMMGSKSAKRAAQAQQDIDNRQLALQQKMYEQNRTDTLAGQTAATGYIQGATPKVMDYYRAIPGQTNAIYGQAEEQMGKTMQGLKTNIGGIYGTAQQQASQSLAGGLTAQQQALGQSYGQIAGLGQPYQQAGQGALSAYSQQATNPFESALFKQKLAKGQAGVSEAMAAQGLGRSGAAIKAQSNMYQDLAAQEQALAEQRQMNLIGIGQQQTAGLQNVASQYGMAEANAQLENAQQQASLQQQYGTQMAGMYGSLGQQELNFQQNRATANAQATQQMYNNLAAAEGTQASQLANIATGGASQLAGIGQNYAQMGSQTLTGLGQSQAAGALGQGQAWQGALGGVSSVAGMYMGLQGQQQPAGSSPSMSLGYGSQPFNTQSPPAGATYNPNIGYGQSDWTTGGINKATNPYVGPQGQAVSPQMQPPGTRPLQFRLVPGGYDSPYNQ